MVHGSCHCGAQRFSAPAPDSLTRCTCSICARTAILCAYYPPEAVTLQTDPATLTTYQWGDRMITFHHCATCGCAVFNTSPELTVDGRHFPARVTLNARLFEGFDPASTPIREVDGRNDW